MSEEDIEAFVTAAARIIGVPLAPKHQPGVVMNLQRITAMARLVNEFQLPPDVEPAPVFSHDRA
jgi:Protein of unknown function (DUF4089)